MSSPVFLPTGTAPFPTVRSFGQNPTRSHEVTSSQKRAPAITMTALAQPIRADLFPRPLSDGAAWGRSRSQAAEDQGAVHLNSAANIPPRRPAHSGSHDPEHISQDAATFLDSPKSLPPSLSSLSLSLERIRPRPSTTSIRTSSTDSQSTSSSATYAFLHSSDHIINASPVDAYPGAAPTIDYPAWPPLYQGTKSSGALESTQMSGARDRERDPNQNVTKPGELSSEARRVSSDARREAFSEGKRNRSSSRPGNGRVEQRIEATLAKAEPGSSARSRKSSHILGLFKENTASQDVRKSQDRARPSLGTAEDDTAAGWTGPEGENAKIKESESFKAPTAAREGDAGNGFNDPSVLENKDNSESCDSLTRVSTTQQTRRTSSISSSTSRMPLIVSQEIQKGGSTPVASPTTMPEDSTENILDVPRSDVPQRLLEEIRTHHNLAAPFHDKFKSPYNATIADLSRIETDFSPGRLAQTVEDPDHHKGEGSPREKPAEAEEEDDEESDKEQISSALYYPHQAPSPNALEDVSIDNNGQFIDPQYAGEPNDLIPLSPERDQGETASENVDIALQSRNKSRYLHGDLQTARVPPAEATATKAVEIATSSGSEYESLDEGGRSTAGEYSSLTDEAETTPTATPVANRIRRPRLPRVRRRPTAPLGAVELKPYNHQVGGHTTVFRFSKRAVCKQLSNRENEFYEVVECEHPELLKFLPRYDMLPSSSVFSLRQGLEAENQPSYAYPMLRSRRAWRPSANAHFS